MAERVIPVANSQSEVIPEDGAISYSNVYVSSSSVSSSSLNSEDAERSHDGSGKINYPQDLLGVSWGSYLHSGPPTRAGDDQAELQATSKANALHLKAAMTTHPPVSLVTVQPSGNVQGILRGHPVKETAQPIKHTNPEKTVKIMCKDIPKQEVDELLLIKLRDLIKSLSECRETYDLETVPIPNSLLSALEDCAKTKATKIKPHKDVDSMTSSTFNKILHDIVEYLKETVERLAKQGKKLNEQALFLQRTGKQLGRNHQSLLEEQAMLELASETVKQQLDKEKVAGYLTFCSYTVMSISVDLALTRFYNNMYTHSSL